MFFGWFDAIFSFIFPILFLLFIGMFFFALISNLRTWNKNNHSPRLTVPATVVAKRTDVSHSSSANAGDMSGAHGYDTSTFTSYYVTFQVESGDRMEFEISDVEYGMLAEGDSGELTFQGTRYLNFQRNEPAELRAHITIRFVSKWVRRKTWKQGTQKAIVYG